MGDKDGGTAGMMLEPVGKGVFRAPGARIIDRSGRKKLPIGQADFVAAMRGGTLVDKTALIADVLDSNYAATLFCRPRRFGKTLNMTMMKAYLEAPDAGGLTPEDALAVFGDTDVWDADGGHYRQFQGAHPVVHLSLNMADGDTWPACYGALKDMMAREYLRHRYLRDSDKVYPEEVAYFDRITSKRAPEDDVTPSLAVLCELLARHHGCGTVLLIDEYDAPVMAGHAHGYYDKVVGFMRTWLIGAVKNGGAFVAFSCLTGVQRISKESIFSGLNNLYVSTPLNDDFDERYGFTDAEVAALAAYLGHPDCMPEARAWYDGYRFGKADVYNPWSVISYLNEGCKTGVYWGNTSGNSVLGQLIANADDETLSGVYALLEPAGKVSARLDLGVVFPDLGVRQDAMWSLLYLSGYVTTDVTRDPSNRRLPRELRIPDREVAQLFVDEIVERFTAVAGGARKLAALQAAAVSGDAEAFGRELGRIAREAASYHDLVDEGACHMLLLGLLTGTAGYLCRSNREAGRGRPDIQMLPDPVQRARGPRPLVTLEVKFLKPADAPEGAESLDAVLSELAGKALDQIAEGAYDADPPAAAQGRLRWGVAFSGKRVAVACERV